MANATITFTRMGLAVLTKFLKAHIHVSGTEHIEADEPTLYVVNHFTRFETFLVPYVLYQHSDTAVHSLAHPSLFKGRFGTYLRNTGAMSTGNPARNRKIIGDLMVGRSHWVIYPEGVMVKNKMTVHRGKLRLYTPKRVGKPHTGAAVLGLKAQRYKYDYLRAVAEGDAERVAKYRERYEFTSDDELNPRDIGIVPVNITYFPIRPGANVIKKTLKKLMRDMPPRLEEELEIEGNLLLSETDIHLTFCKRISLADYVPRTGLGSQVVPPWTTEKTRLDWKLWADSNRLTARFMGDIYGAVCINTDHLVCTALELVRDEAVAESRLRQAVFLIVLDLLKTPGRNLHPALRENAFCLVTGEPAPLFGDVIELGMADGTLTRTDGLLRVDKAKLSQQYGFHSVRVNNTMQVIANELDPLAPVVRLVGRTVNLRPKSLRSRVARRAANYDLELFEADYAHYHNPELSKPREIGRPFFLRAESTVGVVLSHGFLGAAEEVRPLAEHLHAQGYSVYGVRLKGHGTAPRNLADVEWSEWLQSYLRGLAVMRHSCERVILGGFSTGGILALLAAATVDIPIAGIFAINAPLKLVDVRSRLVPAVILWNDLLKKFRIGKDAAESVEHFPENPGINYTVNYLRGVRELGELMGACEAALPKVTQPTLIIQGDKDPAVSPKSAHTIHSKIASERKKLIEMPFERHCIIRDAGSAEVFQHVVEFVRDVAGPGAPRAPRKSSWFQGVRDLVPAGPG